MPDRIAIMDDYTYSEMIMEGFDKERLVVTGNPHFDDLENKMKNFREEDKNRIREQIGINSKDLFCYFSSVFEEDKEKYGFWDLDNLVLINDVLRVIKNDVGVVVKIHPRTPDEDINQIKNYIENFKNELYDLDVIYTQDKIIIIVRTDEGNRNKLLNSINKISTYQTT